MVGVDVGKENKLGGRMKEKEEEEKNFISYYFVYLVFFF